MTGGGQFVSSSGGTDAVGFNARGTVGGDASGHFNLKGLHTNVHINGPVTAIVAVDSTAQKMTFRVTTKDARRVR